MKSVESIDPARETKFTLDPLPIGKDGYGAGREIRGQRA